MVSLTHEQSDTIPPLPITTEGLIDLFSSTRFVSQIQKINKHTRQPGGNSEIGFVLMRNLHSKKEHIITTSASGFDLEGRMDLDFNQTERAEYLHYLQKGFFTLIDVHSHPPFMGNTTYDSFII